ncbi:MULTISPECIES: response regulator [Oscillatoriales]|uniref:response regulator n=1 Tax=Oscillatoriales TaxID=1150 RepID=UPI0001C38700|nr:histidine kinase [Arthrospira platensis str. Paraca]MDT9312226.1 response regulator [Limnospira sp. Paracas R14]
MIFNILWVEESQEFNSTLEDTIALEEFNIICAEGGSWGAQIAKEIEPNLIISSLNLSDRNTDRFIRRLQQNQKTADIPVILIQSEFPVSCRSLGFQLARNHYLTTAKNVNNLIATILNDLSRKAASRSIFIPYVA